MEMVTCSLCNKPFASAGPKICVRCLKRLDTVYVKARDYIRENPKARMSVSELADAIQKDLRDLEVLIAQKRLDRDASETTSEDQDEESRRKKLLATFQRSISDSAGGGESKKAYRSYGEERYGRS